MSEVVRIDKWLWAARFFKTRALARAAVIGGKVSVSGRTVKPGRAVKFGDRLSVRRGEETIELTILDICDKRVSAPLAQAKYQEDPASQQRRQQAAEERAGDKAIQANRSRRPDKRQRRKIVRFTRTEN